MFKYAILATSATAVSLKPAAGSGIIFSDDQIRAKHAGADRNDDGLMTLSELRQDYIEIITGLSTELRAVFEIYNEVIENCDFGPGNRGAITSDELLECLEDYRNGV